MKRPAIFGLLLMATFCIMAYACWQAGRPAPSAGRVQAPAQAPAERHSLPLRLIAFENGLNPAERQEFYHLAEGSEVFPLEWLYALVDRDTGRPFLDDVERFGFLPDAYHPDRLPVGLSTAPSRGLEPLGKMVGLNCAACHVGEITYKGQRVRVDGAPNLLNTRLFFAHLVESAEATATEPRLLIAFLARLREVRTDQKAAASSGIRAAAGKLTRYMVVKGEDVLARALAPLVKKIIDREKALPVYDFTATLDAQPGADAEEFRKNVLRDFHREDVRLILKESTLLKTPLERIEQSEEAVQHWLEEVYLSVHLLRARAVFLRRLGLIGQEQGTDWGPGRVDAFGSARAFLFEPGYVPLNAVSYPHLWSMNRLGWFHYDNNTTSVLERNFGQALGVGAVHDPSAFSSTLQPMNLHRLEVLARQITPPRWPEKVLGPIDADRSRRGAVLFKQHCAECHPLLAAGQPDPGLLFAPDQIGTDPHRAAMFAETLPPTATPPFADMPFAAAIGLAMKRIKEKSFTALTKQQLEQFANEPKAEWRAPGKYAGRALEGVWATAPYLHNGSVPTLYDLLLPAAQRPETFVIGSREYDPMKLGYESTPDSSTTWGPRYRFDTTAQGNSNAGHEYGTMLPKSERTELLEFLKTQ